MPAKIPKNNIRFSSNQSNTLGTTYSIIIIGLSWNQPDEINSADRTFPLSFPNSPSIKASDIVSKTNFGRLNNVE